MDEVVQAEKLANPRFDIYIDAKGEFRWRFISHNGRIMADSGEGYDNASNAKRGAKKFVKLVRSELVEYQRPTAGASTVAKVSSDKE